MTGFLIVAASTAVLVIYATLKTAHKRLTHHGLAVGTVRYLAGNHWTGKHPTNSTFLRDATGSHAAPRFYHRAGWKRLLRRSGPVFALISAGLGYTVNATATVAGAAAALAAGAVLAAWRAMVAVRRRRHRLAWVYPLHLALAEDVGYSLADRPERWLDVDQDRTRAKLMLPTGCNFNERERKAIEQAAASKLALESPAATWTLHGQTPSLILKASKPPPARVTFEELLPAVGQAAADELVFGQGKESQAVKVSLSGDSPHIALSMGSGGGKSVTASSLLAQHLHRGGVALVTDPKLISVNWARGLPSVAYAGTPAELHAALLWLESEVERRNAVALASADVDGTVHANVGPRLLWVAEELNITLARLRAYWRQSGGQGRSPAIEAFETVLFAGRQVKVHGLLIAQMLSVRAAGSGEARENMGVRVLGRYSANAWKMLAPEHVMPPASRAPGRVQVVTDTVRECQTPYIRPAEAREYALAGTVVPCPAGMPCRGVTAPGAPAVETGADLCDVPASGGPVPALPPGAVTLRQAVEAGVVSRSLTALRKARHRGGFPEPVAELDGAFYYDPAALAAWAGGDSG